MNVMIGECDNKVLTFLLPGWSAPGPVAGQKKHPKLKAVQRFKMAFWLHSFKMSIFPCETIFAGFKWKRGWVQMVTEIYKPFLWDRIWYLVGLSENWLLLGLSENGRNGGAGWKLAAFVLGGKFALQMWPVGAKPTRAKKKSFQLKSSLQLKPSWWLFPHWSKLWSPWRWQWQSFPAL